MSRPDLRFLIVDDFELGRNLIKKKLTENGFRQYVEASNGQEAFDKLSAAQVSGKPFQFIFSDLHMPKTSGLDFLRMTRADDRFRDVPFVVVSAEGETEAIVECLNTGANDFICKPFTGEEIIRKIDKILSKLTRSAS